MAQEEKNGDDSGGKYVLRHDEISDKREVHGYRQLDEAKEDTNSTGEKKGSKARLRELFLARRENLAKTHRREIIIT